MEYNDLNYAIQNGMLDLDVIQSQIEMRKKQHYLDSHGNKIWQGDDGYWYTYLPSSVKGRTLLKRKDKEDLQEAVVKYYSDREKEPLVKDVFDEWLNDKLSVGEIKRGTYDRYSNDYKRFIGGTDLEKTKIRKVSEEQLEDFIRYRISELSLSQKAYSNLRTLIIGLFKYAKRKKYSAISISTFFKDLDISRRVFTNKVKSKESQVFSEDEVPKIIEWLKKNPCVENYGIILTFQTGIREGELAALKFSDVVDSQLHVQRQEIKYKDENRKRTVIHEIVEYTKTEAGNRYIILPPQALETIKKIRELNPDSEYMMSHGDKRINTNTFNAYLYKACDGIGVPKRSMHKIRKTYGTTLIDSGTEDGLIMAQMGHSDIATTRKYYYFSNKSSEHNRDRIAAAIGF